MHIEQARAATPELIIALERLIPQLTSPNPPPARADLQALLDSTSSLLVIGREPDAGGTIIAAGCLGVYRAPTGVRAVIEDLVVDETYRGRGIGEALLRYLLNLAREQGAPGVSLTSNPRREAAKRLYVRAGFSLRQTNSYYCRF
jgi:ribosomal protein S18 acetylase RimI-like enzyme